MKIIDYPTALLRLLPHWIKMTKGISYWHRPQGLGKHFTPNQINGYFNDLTSKTHWAGPTDMNGLPLVDVNGKMVLFPTTLFQKALGHWDFIVSGETHHDCHDKSFIEIANWAIENQDRYGGWPIWSLLDMEYPSDYSAMTQGQGVSLLVRAYTFSGDERYLQSAKRALELLLKEISEGGTSRIIQHRLILEEYPAKNINGALNGWIFAIFGLYDFLIVNESQDIRDAMEATLSSMAEMLPEYDTGYWSSYDLTGNLASPFYHQLHISQLIALSIAFPNYDIFKKLVAQFKKYDASKTFKLRAVSKKFFQKILKVPQVIIK